MEIGFGGFPFITSPVINLNGMTYAFIRAMTETMTMCPPVAEVENFQARKHHEAFATTMTSRCECLCCRGGIEFEASEFQEKIRTLLLIFGQNIKCPHCNRTTSVYLDNKSGRVFKSVNLNAD